MFRVYFAFSALLMSGIASPIPSQSPDQVELQQVLLAAMDETRAEMMKPGPKRDGWEKGGVDLYRLVEAAPGGVAQNYLLSVDKDGERTITIVRARDLSIVPTQWKSISSAGSSNNIATSHSLSLGKLDGKYYIVGWENLRRVGDAFCSTGTMDGHLYERPDAASDGEIPPEMIPTMFAATVQMLKKQTFCWRYDRVGDAYRTSYFLEDGRTLPVLDGHDDMATIVPASPIEALLDGVPGRP